jgi:hypothetical protein
VTNDLKEYEVTNQKEHGVLREMIWNLESSKNDISSERIKALEETIRKLDITRNTEDYLQRVKEVEIQMRELKSEY